MVRCKFELDLYHQNFADAVFRCEGINSKVKSALTYFILTEHGRKD